MSLWGESIENIFYLIAQIVGFAAWRKHMIAGTSDNTEQFETRIFEVKDWLLAILRIGIFTAIAGHIFQITNGTQPYIDALTQCISVVAQIIMLLRYREQWIFWFVPNLVSLYQWITLGNMSHVALYIAMIINNLNGCIEWTRVAKQ